MHWGPRDKTTGRFLKYKTPGEANTSDDKAVFEALKEGFIAGMNAQSGILLPSKKLKIFLSQKGYK